MAGWLLLQLTISHKVLFVNRAIIFLAKLNKIKSIFLAELNKLGNEHTDLRINKMSRSRWLRHKKRLLQPLFMFM